MIVGPGEDYVSTSQQGCHSPLFDKIMNIGTRDFCKPSPVKAINWRLIGNATCVCQSPVLVDSQKCRMRDGSIFFLCVLNASDSSRVKSFHLFITGGLLLYPPLLSSPPPPPSCFRLKQIEGKPETKNRFFYKWNGQQYVMKNA